MTAPRRARLELALLLLVAALSAHQVLVSPIVGVADNGDFTRVMNPLGLAHLGTSYEDRYFLWVQPRYRVVPRDTSMLTLSSELLLAGLARGIDRVLSPDGVFDLRVLGAVHLAFYLVGVWLVLGAVRPLGRTAHAVALAGLLLATPDVAYVAFFNSFYGEPAGLIFLLFFLGVALRCVRAEMPGRGAILAYFVCAALLLSSKVQYYAMGLPLACLPLALLASRAWRKTWTLVVPLALALLLFSGYLSVRTPNVLSQAARWNALFLGILVDSPSPEADLAEFGLEPGLARFVGGYGIEVDGTTVNAPLEEVARRFGMGDIALFYLRHPDRLIAAASASARRSFEWRDKRLGNYTRDSGKRASTQAPSYTGWSDLEDHLFPKRLWFLAACFSLFVCIAAWELRRGLDTAAARTAALGLTVVGLTLVAFGVKVMAAGGADPVKHLFLFQVLFDVSLFVGLAWLGTRCEPFLPWGAPGRTIGESARPRGVGASPGRRTR